MVSPTDPLPDDLAAAHEMIRRLSALGGERRGAGKSRIAMARLTTILKKLQRRQFGQKSERLDPDQMALGLEDIETAISMAEAHAESLDAAAKTARSRARRAQRGKLPAHLPRIEQLVDIDDKSCPCCGGALHVIGEDVSERLDIVPAQYRVLVTRRPKYACRACTDGVVQAPAPARLIEGGLPTEALIAHLLVGKYADHLPLYRQHQIMVRAGVDIDRGCLAEWVGRAAFALRPVAERMLAHLKTSAKLFCDEPPRRYSIPAAVKRRRDIYGRSRATIAHGTARSAGYRLCLCAGRGGEHALRALQGFDGVLQVDGYGGYNALTDSVVAKKTRSTLRFAGPIGVEIFSISPKAVTRRSRKKC